jgi:hypothetical protein
VTETPWNGTHDRPANVSCRVGDDEILGGSSDGRGNSDSFVDSSGTFQKPEIRVGTLDVVSDPAHSALPSAVVAVYDRPPNGLVDRQVLVSAAANANELGVVVYR